MAAKSATDKKEFLTNTKDGNFTAWYPEVLSKGDMIDFGKGGSYMIYPSTMFIWNQMRNFLDSELLKMNVKEWSTRCFSLRFYENYSAEDLDPELAWSVRDKARKQEMNPSFVLNPENNSDKYSNFSQRIKKRRVLPLRLNQWCHDHCYDRCWTFSNPTPFMRSRDFLWQEGDTAFATKEEADTEVLEILELYRRLYEEYLAVPVVKGKKSELGKFADAVYSTSVEAFIPNTGCGVQGATSHCLGQKFAKKYKIEFQDVNGKTQQVWQNSWNYSTRTIGVMVMVHGDDKGLVLPPKVSEVQVIVIPVIFKDADAKELMNACSETVKTLCDIGIRAEADFRRDYSSPGWKDSHWEMKGVPLRIEIGPKDLANNQVRVVRRDNGSKVDLPISGLGAKVKGLLDDIQQNMFAVAKQKRDSCIQVTKTWEEFTEALGQKKLMLAPWCDEEEVEKDVQAKLGGLILSVCSPFDQPELPEGTLCFASGKPAKKWAYWARSY